MYAKRVGKGVMSTKNEYEINDSPLGSLCECQKSILIRGIRVRGWRFKSSNKFKRKQLQNDIEKKKKNRNRIKNPPWKMVNHDKK